MADSYFTLSSSVVVKIDNKVKPIVSSRLYRFNNKKTWNDVFDEVTDPEEVDLKKTDQILVTVSDRAGQTFEPDMEESWYSKKKIFFYLPTHTQKSWVGFGQTEIFLRMAWIYLLLAVQVHTTTDCRFYREQLGPAPLRPALHPWYNFLMNK